MQDYCWQWFDLNELRPRSKQVYGSMLRSVIVPHWGPRPVGEITSLEYDVWKTRIRGKYSHNYAAQVLGLFRMLMDDAVVRYKLRSETPVIEQRRRGRYTKKQTRRAKQAMPIEVVHQLAANSYHVWGFTGWVYIWTIACTGMRPPGEMWGLQRGYSSVHWPDADPDSRRRSDGRKRYTGQHVLRVQVQLYYADGQPTLAGPKYDSDRTLVLPPFLHEMHEALLASHASPWVFPALKGGSLLGAHFARDYWHPARDGRPERCDRKGTVRAGLDGVEGMSGQDLYRLRHWHKELMDEPGADIARVAVEVRMGHELPGVEGVYSFVTPAMEARIVDYLQEVWEKMVAKGLWLPPFPNRLPSEGAGDTPPLFSGVREI